VVGVANSCRFGESWRNRPTASLQAGAGTVLQPADYQSWKP